MVFGRIGLSSFTLTARFYNDDVVFGPGAENRPQTDAASGETRFFPVWTWVRPIWPKERAFASKSGERFRMPEWQDDPGLHLVSF